MPEAIAPEIELRPTAEADLPFLRALFASTRWQEMAATGWRDDQKQAFLDDQFRLQDLHYTTHYPDGEFHIITRGGEPIGRLYLYRGPAAWQIVDISLLPPWCGQGIGGALLRQTLRDADALKVPVGLHVTVFNPARRLYDRLGFTPVGAVEGLYQKLVRDPQGKAG